MIEWVLRAATNAFRWRVARVSAGCATPV